MTFTKALDKLIECIFGLTSIFKNDHSTYLRRGEERILLVLSDGPKGSRMLWKTSIT